MDDQEQYDGLWKFFISLRSKMVSLFFTFFGCLFTIFRCLFTFFSSLFTIFSCLFTFIFTFLQVWSFCLQRPTIQQKMEFDQTVQISWTRRCSGQLKYGTKVFTESTGIWLICVSSSNFCHYQIFVKMY